MKKISNEKVVVKEKYVRPDRSKGYMTEEEERQFETLCDAIEKGKVAMVDVTPPEVKKNRTKEFKESVRHIKHVKDTSISLRVSENILQLVKEKAKKEGIPYQTLIGSWIYKHAIE